MENKPEVLLINLIDECIAIASEEELQIFYTFIQTYLEEKKKQQ